MDHQAPKGELHLIKIEQRQGWSMHDTMSHAGAFEF
jgi:hypothetical protein